MSDQSVPKTPISKATKWVSAIWIAIILFSVGFVYSAAPRFAFLSYDDPDHVQFNPYLQPLTFDRIWFFWRYPFDPSPVHDAPITKYGLAEPYRIIYTPMSFTVHALVGAVGFKDARPKEATKALGTVSPVSYHTFNVLLHALNAVLLYILLRRLLRSEWAAGLGSLVFAVHPVQVEPVAWVTGQNNLLATAFALGALLLYFAPLQGVRDPEPIEPKSVFRRNIWPRLSYYLSVILFAFALLAKPTVAVVPVVALMLDYAFFERPPIRRWLAMVPWLELCAISAIINKSMSDYPMEDIAIALVNRPFVIGDAFLFYLSQVVWPPYLIPDYGRKPSVVLAQPWIRLEWILPAGLVVFLLVARRSASSESAKILWKSALVGLLIFFAILMPTSGLITYYFHSYSTVADRYMYLPMMGVSLAIAGAVVWFETANKAAGRWKTPSVVALVCCLGFTLAWTAKAKAQVPYWSEDKTLWPYVLENNNRSWMAWTNGRNVAEANGDHDTAIKYMLRARDLEPGNWLVRQALADSLYQAGRLQDAATQYHEVLHLNPYNSWTILRLGLIASREGKLLEAARFYQDGLALAPNNPHLLANMGTVACKLGHYEDGEKYIKESMRWGFDAAAGNLYLGISQAQQGHIDSAMVHFERSLKLNDSFFETHFNYALALRKIGQPDAALDHFQQCMALNANYVPAYVELARTLIQQGNKKAAVTPLKDALTLEPKNKEARSLLRQVSPSN